MRTPAERLARLLDRHPELREAAPDEPFGAIIRADEMLVPAAQASRVEESIRTWTDRRADLEHLGLSRFRLRRDADVQDLIATSCSPADGDALASPVHMFRGEPNYQGGPSSPPSPTAPSALPAGGTHGGPSVRVGVLDTGIAAHPWFPQNTWDALDGDVSDRLDTNNDYELDAQAGHGTFIAGIIRQHAPAARLAVGRVLASDGVCDEVELLEALLQLEKHSKAKGRRIDVLNLSLGAYTWNDRPPVEIQQAIARLGTDTVVVAAAGNNSSDRRFWPAAFDSVLAVGALSADGTRQADFSNFGPWVDAWAPGEQVASSFVTFDGPEDEAPGADIDADCFKGFASWSGTSFAAPRVAAALAARAAEDKTTPRRAVEAVLADFQHPDPRDADPPRPT